MTELKTSSLKVKQTFFFIAQRSIFIIFQTAHILYIEKQKKIKKVNLYTFKEPLIL